MVIVNGGVMDAETVRRFQEYRKVELKRFLSEKVTSSPKSKTCTAMAYPSGQQGMEGTRQC